jgi:uncharacterized membrane protein
MRVVKGLRLIIFALSFGWAAHMIANYFLVDPEARKFLLHKVMTDFNQAAWLIILRAHIVTACLALMAGPCGFSKRLLRRNRKLHRTIGKVYVISVAVSCLTACFLVPNVTGGFVSKLAFVGLIALWAMSTYLAYRRIRQKNVAAHRAWMIRSYSMTLANMTLHLMLALLHYVFDVEYVQAYQISVWVCVLLNFLIADVITKRMDKGFAYKETTIGTR